MRDFQVAFGTTTGTEHSLPGSPGYGNSQDGLMVRETGTFCVGVVSDGCGSGKHTEVGAKLLAHLLVTAITDDLHRFKWSNRVTEARSTANILLARARMQALGPLVSLATSLRGRHASLSTVAQMYFEATVVGFIMTDHWTIIFNTGDGYYALNDDLHQLGPFPNNAPPYPAYEFTGSTLLESDPGAFHLHIREIVPTSIVQSLMVATDGLEYLIQAEGTPIPFSHDGELIGPASQLWTDQRFFPGNRKSPSPLQRWLNRVNRDVPNLRRLLRRFLPSDEQFLVDRAVSHLPTPTKGPLKDDLALIAVRRNPATTDPE